MSDGQILQVWYVLSQSSPVREDNYSITPPTFKLKEPILLQTPIPNLADTHTHAYRHTSTDTHTPTLTDTHTSKNEMPSESRVMILYRHIVGKAFRVQANQSKSWKEGVEAERNPDAKSEGRNFCGLFVIGVARMEYVFIIAVRQKPSARGVKMIGVART